MSTIKQKSVPVVYEGGAEPVTIKVHRMAWKPQREFLRLLADLLASTLKLPTTPSEDKLAGLVQAVGSGLPDLLVRSEAISAHLLQHAADLDPSTADTLDGALVAEVLNQALAVNFDDDVKNSFAGIVATVVGALPAQPKAKTT